MKVQAKSSIVGAILVCILTEAALSQGAEEPAPRAFSTIEVIGNDRFRDGDVIATSGLEVGETYSQDDLIASIQNLEFTGEFRSVRIFSTGETLTIAVEEEPLFSGVLGFGLGYSVDTGVFGEVTLGLEDAVRSDTRISATATVSEQTNSLTATANNPRFWPGSVSGGIRAAYADFDYDNTVFDFRRAGLSPYLDVPLGARALVELRYTLTETEIYNVSSTASAILQAEAGRRTSSGLGLSYVVSSDQGVLTSWEFRLDQDVTGLGGDTDLSTTVLSLGARRDLGNSGFALRTKFEAGAVAGRSGDAATAAERFTLGGSLLRGFERGTVSPRDLCTSCAASGGNVLGGNRFALLRTDLILPVFAARDGYDLFLFGDIGSVWDVDTTVAATGVLDDDRVSRASVGLGLTIDTPIGTLEAFGALWMDADTNDEESRFGLSARRQF